MLLAGRTICGRSDFLVLWSHLTACFVLIGRRLESGNWGFEKVGVFRSGLGLGLLNEASQLDHALALVAGKYEFV